MGSRRCPPLVKLMLEMKDKSRPSEQVERDNGGLLSSTKNWERSRGGRAGLVFPGVTGIVLSGMHEERFILIGDLGTAEGEPPAWDGACKIFPEAEG